MMFMSGPHSPGAPPSAAVNEGKVRQLWSKIS
jgi:hypothetical protein